MVYQSFVGRFRACSRRNASSPPRPWRDRRGCRGALCSGATRARLATWIASWSLCGSPDPPLQAWGGATLAGRRGHGGPPPPEAFSAGVRARTRGLGAWVSRGKGQAGRGPRGRPQARPCHDYLGPYTCIAFHLWAMAQLYIWA